MILEIPSNRLLLSSIKCFCSKEAIFAPASASPNSCEPNAWLKIDTNGITKSPLRNPKWDKACVPDVQTGIGLAELAQAVTSMRG